VQSFNSYELTGCMEGAGGHALDDLVIEHLTVQRELRKLNAREEVVLRMMAEGYTVAEIAEELGVSARTVVTLRQGLRLSLQSEWTHEFAS
jgi:DNA-binding NarL/FixJ family response regulator